MAPTSDYRTGLFSSIVAESLEEITFKYLISVINNFSLLKVIRKGLPFDVYDLFRAKCSGNAKEIKQIYENLKKNSNFKIIRVKNRLNTNNKDFLINFMYIYSNQECNPTALFVSSNSPSMIKKALKSKSIMTILITSFINLKELNTDLSARLLISYGVTNTTFHSFLVLKLTN